MPLTLGNKLFTFYSSCDKILQRENGGYMYRKTYVEIDVNQVKKNVKNIIQKYNEYKWYIGVVKGNAYGHGMEIAKYIIEAGINYLAVSSLEEAIEVRKYEKATPILCLEPIDIEDLQVCISENVSITIHSYEYFEQLLNCELSGKIKAHLKLDTGMNRLGIKEAVQVEEIYNKLQDNEKIELEGIYSHFGTLGIWDKAWDNQVENFNKLTKNIDLSKIKMVHFARGASIINHKKIENTNGVRLGISMYGYVNNFSLKANSFRSRLRVKRLLSNNKRLGISECIFDDIPDVKPCLALKSKILQIKEVKKGQLIGYGTNHVAQKDMLVATIPVGYADGIDVRNTGRNVEIGGKLFKIVGTVNMCMISVEVDKTVTVGDIVTVIGGKASAEYIANYLNTNRYIVVTTIAKDIPRVYVGGNKNEE